MDDVRSFMVASHPPIPFGPQGLVALNFLSVLVPAERPRDLAKPPVYLLGAAQGSEYRNAAPGHNTPTYGSSSFTTVAPRLYEAAGVSPGDVNVVQSYENFTGGVLMSMVEHGFCQPEEANDFFVLEHITWRRMASYP